MMPGAAEHSGRGHGGSDPSLLAAHPGQAVSSREIPQLSVAGFRRAVIDATRRGGRLAALFVRSGDGESSGEGVGLALHAVVADGGAGALALVSCALDRDTRAYPALTPECPEAHLFEREIAERWGVTPEGHPALKPVRFLPRHGPAEAEPARDPARAHGALPGVTDFFTVQGDEIHEVAIGPVHAGVIEPGHFRFQCHGERVLHLEISLGYQHRGIERALVGGPRKRSIHLIETLAGDTTIGHATAHCEALEGLAGCRVPARAQALRGIALELERLANHTGDLGALAGDVGYLPTAAFCGRLRGEFLNMTALVCGSRFGRGWIRSGGVAFDVDGGRAASIEAQLARVLADATEAVGLLWDSASVQARFEETGALPARLAEEIGLVGPAARACGLERDARHEFPTGIWRFSHVPVATWHTGDVFARAFVRWLEIQRSAAFVREQLATLPGGLSRAEVGPLAPNRTVVSLVEGWRGEVCHVASTDQRGMLLDYKVVDPSFHNWMGLALAMRGQAISDFPLCNKSFNLSYCGHDL
jgi:Ni,Fe-hydrogenase III large subunit/Ni,Fe-hydrogenase III component G